MILARAEAQAQPVLAQAARDVRADAARVIAGDLAGLPSQAPAGMEPPRPLAPERPFLPEPPALEAARADLLARRAVQHALGLPAPPEWRSLPLVLHQAGLNALRDTDDAYQQIIRDVMQNVTSAGTALPQMSRLKAAQEALDRFAQRGITGFTDSTGRNWDLTSYVEMATRTAASRMHLALQLGAMGPAGFDLVIVDNPTRLAPCKMCRPWEGKVLSLTGAHPPGEHVSATSADGRSHTVQVAGTLAEARLAGLLHPLVETKLPALTAALH